MDKIKAIYPIPVGDRIWQAGEYPTDLEGKQLEKALADGHAVMVKKKKVKRGKNS